MNKVAFKKYIWNYYKHNKRDMPWRETSNPYYILVSEVMLQQTQVTRVAIKFSEFITLFPDFKRLAEASVGDVLKAWSGMGYNRRDGAAQIIISHSHPLTYC